MIKIIYRNFVQRKKIRKEKGHKRPVDLHNAAPVHNYLLFYSSTLALTLKKKTHTHTVKSMEGIDKLKVYETALQ